jgi:hypothetical protein
MRRLVDEIADPVSRDRLSRATGSRRSSTGYGVSSTRSRVSCHAIGARVGLIEDLVDAIRGLVEAIGALMRPHQGGGVSAETFRWGDGVCSRHGGEDGEG